MEQKLKAERREDAGKGVARKLRSSGRVPAVVYGHGVEPMKVSVDAKELSRVLHTDAGMNVLIDLRVDNENLLAMPREAQRDYLLGRFLHIDFLRIARDEKIAVEVPIHVIGDSHGVKEGGVVEHHLWTLHVQCFPQDVPTSIDADITALGINESLRVSDLVLPATLTVLTPMEETVVSVVTPQVLRVEEAVAAEGALVGEEAAEGAPSEPAGEGSADSAS